MHPVPASAPTPASSGRGEGGGSSSIRNNQNVDFWLIFMKTPCPSPNHLSQHQPQAQLGLFEVHYYTTVAPGSALYSSILTNVSCCYLLTEQDWGGGGYGRKNVEWITRPGHVTTHFSCYCYLRLWMSYRLQNGNTHVYISVIDQLRL